ncbi:MAG: nucleotide sugar dehydrogenase, partial [Planctomycetales bacterium]
MTKVAVIGTGYVGCVTAACMSRDGHEVIGVDVDPEKVAAINAGDSPVSEPGLGDLVRQEVARGGLRATKDLDEAIAETQIGLISVGTPSDSTGGVSTDAVERVVRAVGESLRDNRDDYTVVIRSTLLPGILEDWLAPLLYQAAGCKPGERIRLCNNPEFLRESVAISDYDAPPFIVVGTMNDDNGDEILGLYDKIPGDRIVTDSRTAALLKYSCNAYHAAKIAFANEIGSLAKAFDADGQ